MKKLALVLMSLALWAQTATHTESHRFITRRFTGDSLVHAPLPAIRTELRNGVV
jgi:hypothetical protein